MIGSVVPVAALRVKGLHPALAMQVIMDWAPSHSAAIPGGRMRRLSAVFLPAGVSEHLGRGGFVTSPSVGACRRRCGRRMIQEIEEKVCGAGQGRAGMKDAYCNAGAPRIRSPSRPRG